MFHIVIVMIYFSALQTNAFQAGLFSNVQAGLNDTNPFCCYWAKNDYCNQNAQWMLPNCPISCGTTGCKADTWHECGPVKSPPGCRPPKTEASREPLAPASTQAPLIRQRDNVCCTLAQQGYCKSEPGWMLPNCPEICGTPGCSISNLRACVEPMPIPNCRPKFSGSQINPTTAGLPSNNGHNLNSFGLPDPPEGARQFEFDSTAFITKSTKNDQLCCILAQQGFCHSNPSWMLPTCPIQCGTPNCKADNLPACKAPEPILECRPVRQEGVDKHEHCCRWAQMGHCNVNPSFMLTQCSKSCGTAGCTAHSVTSCLPNPPPECNPSSLPESPEDPLT